MDTTSLSEAADTPGPTLAELIPRIVAGQPITVEEAEIAFTTVMDGRATPVQMAALLTALRATGERPEHVAGGVRAMRSAMIPVATPDRWTIVDTCGTGGGAFTTFNISTAAAIVAAGAGARIAKHGNRSFSSRSGSADVLNALGVRIELTPEQMADVFEQVGIVFMFAPLLHPAMKHVGPIRRELGMPTIMNVLGPLTNPASARRQVVGVSSPALLELIAGGLAQLGHEHALVVHGEPGMDEFSPIGTTAVIELKNGELQRYAFDPREHFDTWDHNADDLRGGDPDYNAVVIVKILEGRLRGSARLAVVLNAGAALYVAGIAPSLLDGCTIAERAIDDGAALDALLRLKAATAF